MSLSNNIPAKHKSMGERHHKNLHFGRRMRAKNSLVFNLEKMNNKVMRCCEAQPVDFLLARSSQILIL